MAPTIAREPLSLRPFISKQSSNLVFPPSAQSIFDKKYQAMLREVGKFVLVLGIT